MDRGTAPFALALGTGPLDSVKRAVRRNMELVGRLVGASGISPNALTFLGLALSLGAAWIVVSGNLLLGGVAFLVANAFDMLDGAVARATGKASRFGAFLDSVTDRYDEGVLFIALLVVASRANDTLLVAVTGLALLGSLL